MADKQSVFFVYLQYGDTHQQEGLARLRKLAPKLFPGRVARYLDVDNALEGDIEIRVGTDCERISGDNRVREFTGYQRGFDWLASRYAPSDETPIVFANDTFFRNYGDRYLDGFRASEIDRALASRCLIGHIDAYPLPVEIQDVEFSRWVRTSFFVSSVGVVRELQPFAIPFSSSDLFGGPGEPFFKATSPIGDRYRDYLETWLFGVARRPEFDHHWHSCAPLTEENRIAMQEKVRCILSEHALSARATAAGISLIAIEPSSLKNALKKAMRYSRRLKQLLADRTVRSLR